MEVLSQPDQSNPAAGSLTDCERRVRQLERQLQSVTTERNDLERDVEQLCMSRGSNMFSSSYVLSQRMQFLEAQVKEQRMQLRSVTTERDGLLEDIMQIRSSKHESDQGWQQEKQHSIDLERHVSFFQTQSAQAIAERDSLAYELKQCSKGLQTTNTALNEAKAQLAGQQQHTQNVEAQLAAVRQQVEDLKGDLTVARGQLKQLPVVQQQLQQQTDKSMQLQIDLSESQGVSNALRSELAAAEEQLRQSWADAAKRQQQIVVLQRELTVKEQLAQGQLKELKDANDALHKQIHEMQVQTLDLQQQLEQTSAALVASQAKLKEMHAASNKAAHRKAPTAFADSSTPQDINRLQEQLVDAEESLQQAARDKLDIMQQLSEAQAHEDEQLHIIQQLEARNNQLKVLLAQATQEKVEALLKAAQLDAAADTTTADESCTSAAAAPYAAGVVLGGLTAPAAGGSTLEGISQEQAAAMALKAGAPRRGHNIPHRGYPATATTTPPPSPATSAFMFPSNRRASGMSSKGGVTGTTCVTPPPSPALSSFMTSRRPSSERASAAASVHDRAASSSGSSVQAPPTPGRLIAAVAAAAAADEQQHGSRSEDQPTGAVTPASAEAAQGAQSSGSLGSTVNKAIDAALHTSLVENYASAECSSGGSSSEQVAVAGTPWQAEREQLLQQLQHRTKQLEQLVLFAGHCRMILQDLQPGAVAAAAAADGQKGGRHVKDPMVKLSALANELEASRKLLCTNRAAQQQHDAALTSMLASTAASVPASLVKSLLTPSEQLGTSADGAAPVQQGMFAALGKFWGGISTSSSGSTTSLLLNAVALPGQQQAKEHSTTSSSGGNPGQGLLTVGVVDAADMVWAAQLVAALACEVQLLSDLCISALRHIHKLAALSNLMEDYW